MTNELKDKAIDPNLNDNNGDDQDDLELDLGLDDGEENGGDKNKNNGNDNGNKNLNETPEQKSSRLARMHDRHDKKHGLGKYAQANEKKSSEQPSEVDYGMKAFLIASGIKGEEESGLVKKIMADTGKTADQVLESTYFQLELKELRETKASKDAIPSGSKRSGNPASNEVEYWLAKDELPPADQVDLRRKVVNAKIKAKSSGNPFTNNPVVM